MEVNKLINRVKFEILLKDYRPNETLQTLIKEVPLVLLVAPVAGGRNTIIKELLNSNLFQFLISDTSRKPRENNHIMEQDGREYWFKSEDYMLQELQKQNYLSPAIIHQQQVSGINYKEFERLKNTGLIGITDIDIQGSNMIYEMEANCKYIFILPPNYSEWMRRFNDRGDISNDERSRRLHSALIEIESALSKPYFCFLINNELSKVTKEIIDYVQGNYHQKDNTAREQAQKILDQLRQEAI